MSISLAPNHAYADGLDKERVITMTFTNDITYVQTERIMMVGFPDIRRPKYYQLNFYPLPAMGI